MLHRHWKVRTLRIPPSFLFVFLLGLALISCGDEENGQAVGRANNTAQKLTYVAPDLVAMADLELPHVAPGTMTFSTNIAPIIFENCTICHRPGEAAPFSFLNYAQIKKRARQIAEVTSSRFMPPWGPTPGVVDFKYERELDALEIAQIAQWYQDGSPEGDPKMIPELPPFDLGWALGKPDLVVRTKETFTVPTETPDTFRNFVMPVDIDSLKFVRAVEVRPRNLKVAHHGILNVDPTSSSRQQALETETPGFPGMDLGLSVAPGGQFIGWTPGKKPAISPPKMAWKLERGSDLVLNMHMVTTGKLEKIDCEVGLYFTDEAPTRESYSLVLRNNHILVSAGAKDYWIEDSFVLPTTVKVLRIYPHAHYIGREIRAFALLPKGKKIWLFHDDDWDFNWQDQYEFENPPRLPKGTRIVLQICYDNSAENPRNPNSPPRPINYGPSSFDEMGTCAFMLLPQNEKGAALLAQSEAERHLQKDRGDWRRYGTLGRSLANDNKFEAAIDQFELGLKLVNHPSLHANLGGALTMLGRSEEALDHYRTAVGMTPDDSLLRYNYAISLKEGGHKAKAVKELQLAIKLDAYFAKAYVLLGETFESVGKAGAAITCFERAIKAKPKLYLGYQALGTTLANFGYHFESIQSLQQALALAPEDSKLTIKSSLAWAIATDPKCTRNNAEVAIELAKDVSTKESTPEFLDILAVAYAARGDFRRATETLKLALSLLEESAQHKSKKIMRKRLRLFREGKKFTTDRRPIPK